MIVRTSLLLTSILLSSTVLYASDEVTGISNSRFRILNFDKIENSNGFMTTGNKFLDSTYKTTSKGSDLPSNLAVQFDQSSNLIIHNSAFKIPKKFDSFVNTSLKNKAAIEKNLLYNSKINVPNNTFAPCSTLTGDIVTDMNLPKFLTMFNYPEKLECDVSITNEGMGKHLLKPQMLSQLPKNLEDKDVRHLSLSFSNCNMIFKGLAQDIYFIRASDGNTIVLSDNYSLVKKTTLAKLSKVSLFISSPEEFIDDQLKKNMSGLLKYVNAPK